MVVVVGGGGGGWVGDSSDSTEKTKERNTQQFDLIAQNQGNLTKEVISVQRGRVDGFSTQVI